LIGEPERACEHLRFAVASMSPPDAPPDARGHTRVLHTGLL
jgi:hypothetical protein